MGLWLGRGEFGNWRLSVDELERAHPYEEPAYEVFRMEDV